MDQIVGPLLQNGLPGIAILVLLWVCKTLWDSNNTLQASRLAEKDQRLEDTKQAMASVVSALKTIDSTIAALQSFGGDRK